MCLLQSTGLQVRCFWCPLPWAFPLEHSCFLMNWSSSNTSRVSMCALDTWGFPRTPDLIRKALPQKPASPPPRASTPLTPEPDLTMLTSCYVDGTLAPEDRVFRGLETRSSTSTLDPPVAGRQKERASQEAGKWSQERFSLHLTSCLHILAEGLQKS